MTIKVLGTNNEIFNFRYYLEADPDGTTLRCLVILNTVTYCRVYAILNLIKFMQKCLDYESHLQKMLIIV